MNFKSSSIISAIFITACCNNSYAQSEANNIWLNLGFYSHHFDSNKSLRNANPGFGIEYKIDDVKSLTFGRFLNSDNAQSNYIGGYYQPYKYKNLKFGAVGGLFNGYPNAYGGGWFPAVLPVVSWEGRGVGFNLALVPPLKDRLYGAFSLQIKFNFNP